MLRLLTLLPALVAVVAASAPPVSAASEPDGERPPLTSRSQTRSASGPAPDDAPLALTIDSLSPSYIPVAGVIRVSGAVTNTSEDTWRNINVYAFAGATPITSTAQLAQERALDPAQPVGDRITAADTFDAVDDLAPGESAQYALKIPRSALEVTAAGVYWFGAHALGEGPEGRDATADGRARTFLPLVPRTRRSLDIALVIPVRHDVRHTEDGSLADVRRWAADLDAGALRALVDFGASAGSRPVTWLVDPAVPEAVQTLVEGNPARSLADTVDRAPEVPENDDGATGDPEPTADPGTGETATPGSEERGRTSTVATEPGTAWLDRLREAVSGHQVLALPYGDLDVSAAAERDPGAYLAARRRSGALLQPGGIGTGHAVSPPAGFVDPSAIGALHRRDTVLVSDRMFGADVPAVARSDGRRLVVTSSVAEGGPGPDDPLAAVALRQQIVSEAALRLLEPARRPLVVLLPDDWVPSSTTGFFEGLDVGWITLTDVDGLASRPGRPVPSERLAYPAAEADRELDAANFASAAALAAAAETLQNVLTGNDRVASEVRDEALTGLSYASRDHPDAARAAADRSRRWIEAQLGSVTVNAPPAVTLSSSTGRFSATVTNELDHAVRVRLDTVADEPLEIEGPETIEIAAKSSTAVLLHASRARLGVSNVQLVVTDETGTPLGATDTLPVRSVQVSQLIWVILGSGVALLFGAIAVRLVRRIRRARAA